MPATLPQIAAHLTEIGLKFRKREGTEGLDVGFTTKVYRNPSGAPELLIVIRADRDGGYVQFAVPSAFRASGPHLEACLKACMMAQWRTKLIQFEYDELDAMIQPIIEIPVEDSTLTVKQVGRCVFGLVGILDVFYPVFARAENDGVVEFPDELFERPSDEMSVLRTILDRLRASANPADRAQVPLVEGLIARLEGRRNESGPPRAV